MIRGIDFYSFVLKFSKNFKNVTFKKENILNIGMTNEKGVLISDKSKYVAKYIFNSTNLFLPKISTENSLLQHFEGWFIKSEEETTRSYLIHPLLPILSIFFCINISTSNTFTWLFIQTTRTKKAKHKCY